MTDPDSVAKAIFEGCSANLGPLIGAEIESGPVQVEMVSEPPEGDLAVLPISCETDDGSLPLLQLASPLAEITILARRMNNDEDPSKEDELSPEDVEAVGEVFNLMSGAFDLVMREQVNTTLRSRALPWWRTSEPGENEFGKGEFLFASGSLQIAGGSSVKLFLRFPAQLLAEGAQTQNSKRLKQALLLGLTEELQQSLRPTLESAGLQVEATQPGAEDVDEFYDRADTLFLSDEGDDALELCRLLRLADATWKSKMILCMSEPTRSRVVRAIESGASHVLRVPADKKTVLALLGRAKPQN